MADLPPATLRRARRRAAATTAAATLLVVAPTGAALAEEDHQQTGTPVVAVVPEADCAPGALTLTVPAGTSASLDDLTHAGDRIHVDGALPTVVVSDSRATGGGGWTVAGSASDLAAGAASIGAENLGWQPATSAEPAQPGPATDAALDGGPGLAAPAVLAHAGASGLGSAEIGGNLRLTVGVDTAPGTYRSTISMTLFPQEPGASEDVPEECVPQPPDGGGVGPPDDEAGDPSDEGGDEVPPDDDGADDPPADDDADPGHPAGPGPQAGEQPAGDALARTGWPVQLPVALAALALAAGTALLARRRAWHRVG